MPEPIDVVSSHVDLSQRFKRSTTVVASPALAAETIVAQVAVPDDEQALVGVRVEGWLSITIGTSGASLRLRIRQTGLSGTVVVDTGALTGGIAAGNVVAQDACGFDNAPVLPGQVYVLTAQVASGAAASTVSAVYLSAIVI